MQPKLSVTRVSIPVPDLPPSLEGFKIVQLSDIHYDLPRKRTMTEELLAEIIQVQRSDASAVFCFAVVTLHIAGMRVHSLICSLFIASLSQFVHLQAFLLILTLYLP